MRKQADRFDPALTRLAEGARALSHPARLAILRELAAHETCLCGELVDVLPLAQSTVSRHLQTLREAGLIRGEIDGPRSCYCLDHDALRALAADLQRLFERVSPSATPDASCC